MIGLTSEEIDELTTEVDEYRISCGACSAKSLIEFASSDNLLPKFCPVCGYILDCDC